LCAEAACKDFGGHTCHSCLSHIIHNDDIELHNTGGIIAASVESKYNGVVQRGHHLVRPSELIFVGADNSFDDDTPYRGFFCHSRPQVFRFSLHFVTVLVIDIAALRRGDRNRCIFDDEANIPTEPTYT